MKLPFWTPDCRCSLSPVLQLHRSSFFTSGLVPTQLTSPTQNQEVNSPNSFEIKAAQNYFFPSLFLAFYKFLRKQSEPPSAVKKSYCALFVSMLSFTRFNYSHLTSFYCGRQIGEMLANKKGIYAFLFYNTWFLSERKAKSYNKNTTWMPTGFSCVISEGAVTFSLSPNFLHGAVPPGLCSRFSIKLYKACIFKVETNSRAQPSNIFLEKCVR